MTGLYNIFRLLMVEQIFLSPQMKRNAIININWYIREMPNKLPNDLRITILGNYEMSGKSLNFIDYYLVLSPLLK